MVLKKVAIVNLMGGLGNQLHQIAFSRYLEEHRYSVKIDLSWYNISNFYDGTTQRNLEINVSDFGLEAVETNRKFGNTKSPIYENSKVIKKLYNSHINFLYKVHYGNEYDDSKYRYLNKFNGYWQSSKYIKDSKEFLIAGLRKNPDFNNDVKNEKTMVHIRKGDYVSWGEDLPLEYYKNCLLNLKKQSDYSGYDIFTDLQEIDNKDSLFVDAKEIHNNLSDTGMKTLSNMLKYNNFIISNSSLSFFSAFLGENHKSYIYYPKPWFKSIKHIPYTNQNWSPVEH
jgi:hypothetical protein